ncbi:PLASMODESMATA CALLOSE-BINDING PROTEIN 3-like [Arachis stenosperma]|uniref:PLASMODESMATA CALLOSE-BINDING PROTEIN 3-like n=1 Tax=Arachis stenosperma TaxID=217475 RepID=UPI0025AC8F54|nr:PLASMODESMATA CALLOSE-BINDING PROTEIN 3-like [Arachis stenosperma]
MAAYLIALLLFAFTSSSSGGGLWCVCKDGSDAMLQKTLDYACGAGADCNPLHQGGPCFQPNTVRAHCNYAVNSYFQKKGQAQGACEFAGTATTVTSDPSASGCMYPSTASAAGTSSTPMTNTPSMGTSTGTNPSSGTTSTGTGTGTGTTPYSTSPVLGGIGSGGMGPSGSGMNDESHGGVKLVNNYLLSAFSVALFSAFFMVW